MIDGAHRLGALIAWINDDYGDRDMSRDFYGNQIRKEQERTASITRRLIDKEVGSYRQLKAYAQAPVTAPDEPTLLRSRRISTDPVYLQWVVGDASAAEKSFMRINSTAVAISDTEKALIESRRQPGGLAVRAIMRAGTGHEYWSAFAEGKKTEIKALASDIYNQLISPLADYPVVTLDLPATARGYSADSLKTILDLVNFINPGASGSKVPDDIDGSVTIECLKRVKKATERVFGRHPGSLALHPGVYCYNEKGRFIPKAFIGTVGFVSLLEQKNWFAKFTKNRAKFEEFMLTHRAFITHIGKSQGSGGRRGVPAMVRLYEFVLEHIAKGADEDALLKAIYADESLGFLKGATKEEDAEKDRFRKDDEAAVLLRETLNSELKCPICQARIYRKHVSRDHTLRREDGGTSTASNLQLTHPYCNTGYKEQLVAAERRGEKRSAG